MSFLSHKYAQVKALMQRLISLPTTSEVIIPPTMSGDTISTIPKDERFSHKPLVLYQTPIGNYYLPADAPHDYVAIRMREGQVFEPEIVDVARKYIKTGTTVLDIGACYGQMSLLFSQLTGEDGQVLSFEADDYVFNILQKNIAANSCSNIRTFFGAVFDKSGEVMIYPVQDFKEYTSYGSYGLDPRATSGRRVETIAIDDLGIQMPISFMKVDVRGSDLPAMRGAIETIRRNQMPIIFEFEQQFQDAFGTTFQDYLDFIHLISYRVEKVIYGINYLIVPDTRKAFAPSGVLPAPGGTVPRNSLEQPERWAMNSRKMPLQRSLCGFLKSRAEVDECTAFLHHNGFVSHNLTCKDWDLAHIIPENGQRDRG